MLHIRALEANGDESRVGAGPQRSCCARSALPAGSAPTWRRWDLRLLKRWEGTGAKEMSTVQRCGEDRGELLDGLPCYLHCKLHRDFPHPSSIKGALCAASWH